MQKLTSAQFAQQIKAKYPQYARVPDEELTKRILEKYPVYRDQVEDRTPAVDPSLTPQWTPPAPPPPSDGDRPSSIPGALGDALTRVGGGTVKQAKHLWDQIATSGKTASDALLRGDVNQALQAMIAPVAAPIQGIGTQGQQAVEALQGKPAMSREQAALTALEQIGIPAVDMKASLDRGDYLDLVGQGLGAYAMFKGPQVAAKRFNAFAEGRRAPKPVEAPPPVADAPLPKVEAPIVDVPPAKPAPIVIEPPKAKPAPSRRQQRDALREEFAARPAEAATDLFLEASHSGMGKFRKDPVPVATPGGKKGRDLVALGKQNPRSGWSNQRGEINQDLLMALGAGSAGALVGAAGAESPLDALLQGLVGASVGAAAPTILRSPRLRNEIGAIGKQDSLVRPEPPSAASPDAAPMLAGFQNLGNGIGYIQFDRAGAPVTAAQVRSMFPGHNIHVTEFKSNILSPHIRKFRIDAFDENGRVSSAPLKQMEAELGGAFHDWQRAGERWAETLPGKKSVDGPAAPKGLLGDEQGSVDPALALRMGAGIGGAAYGAATGTDSNDALGRAIIFGGVALAPTLFLKAKQVPVPSAPRTGALADPKVRQVLTPNRPERTIGDRLKTAIANTKTAFNRAFVFEHGLREAGLTDAVGAVEKLNHRTMDAAKRIAERIRDVVAGDPDSTLLGGNQYRDFSDLVRLRNMKDIAEMGGKLEGDLTPQQVTAALQQLEATVPPNVKAAAERHKALVNEIGRELVERGILSKQAVEGKENYFPSIVLQFMKESDGVSRSRITQPQPGALKKREGSALETQHDYVDTMARYLAQMEDRFRKDDFVKEVTDRYNVLTPDTPLPNDHMLWTYGGKAYGLPKPLVERLNEVTTRDPNELRLMARVTSAWKGITLRSVGLPFHLVNLFGDLGNFAAHEPWIGPKGNRLLGGVAGAPKRLADAAIGTAMKNKADAPNAYVQRLQQLAREADDHNLGTGAASAELGSVVRNLPEVLQATGASPLRTALGKFSHTYDLFNEWRENIPRLAKWMAEVDRGANPKQAAKITREQLIDYTALTPFEQRHLRATWAPFYTFFKKNFENWVPVKADGESLGNATQRLGGQYSKALIPGLAAVMWNEAMFPEAEKTLPDHQRYQFHLLIPYGFDKGEMKLAYFGFPGPANSAAKMVGLGGAIPRTVDLLTGRTTLDEQGKISRQMMRENLVGLANPLAQFVPSALLGADIRTGQAMYPRNATDQEIRSATGRKALDMITPAAQAIRASGDTEGTTASLGALAQRMLTGNVITTVDTDAQTTRAKLNALRDAQTQSAQQYRGAKSPAIEQMKGKYLQLGPERGASQIIMDFTAASRLPGVEGSFLRSIILGAAREAAQSDARLRDAVNRIRLMNEAEQLNQRETPTAVEILKRRGLTGPGK